MEIIHMSGAGNDFVVLDVRGQAVDFETESQRLCRQYGADGFLVKNAEEAAAVMEKIRNHEVDIDAIRKNAYQKIVSEYNLDAMIASYANVYTLAANRQLDKALSEGRIKGVVSNDQRIGTGL